MDFIFDPSLVLYLPLYELDGASIRSQDAYGHLCTVTGAVWRPSGRRLDGIDDEINLDAGIATFASLASGTVIVWFRPDSVTDGNQHTLISLSDKGDATSYFSLRQVNQNLRMLSQEGGIGTLLDVITDENSIAAETWHHSAFRVGPGGNALFVDAVESTEVYSTGNSGTQVFFSDIGDADALRVGIIARVGTKIGFDGLIGEVWIYNRALSLLDIQRNYVATKWRYR